MKKLGLGKVVLLVVILIGITSCKEEEFYEKEFIDTLNDQYERENLPDDVAEAAYDRPEDTSSVTEENKDSNSNSAGTPNDPGKDYPTGTITGTDPASTDDDPGKDYPNNTPPTATEDPAVSLALTTDSFAQNISGSKLDILWVIDNSGSMGDEQKALGENFDAFIKEFTTKEIDFQMAVTTTDTSHNNAGRAYKDSIALLTSKNLKESKSKFLKDFKKLVNVGTRGSGYEKGIKASEAFSNRFSKNWLRPDAYFIIVYMSDEEDQSPKSVIEHLKQIQKWKSNNGLIKAYSIVDMVPYKKRGGLVRGYERYKEISNLTGGEVASIKSDFSATLLEMGGNIAQLSEQFPLSKRPYKADQLTVSVDDIVSLDWLYDEKSNSIKFNSNAIPAEGAQIRIDYNTIK